MEKITLILIHVKTDSTKVITCRSFFTIVYDLLYTRKIQKKKTMYEHLMRKLLWFFGEYFLNIFLYVIELYGSVYMSLEREELVIESIHILGA